MTIEKITKVHLIREDNGESLQAMYNPPELGVDKSANFSQISIPGLSLPRYQFQNGGPKTFSFALEFNQQKNMDRDLKEIIEWIEDLQEPKPGDTVMEKRPPIVILSFGNLFNVQPRGFVTSVRTNYIRFFPDMSPWEVRIELKFERVLD